MPSWRGTVPEAVVEHVHTLTWRTFFRQHFNYGRGAHYFHRTCARRRQGFVRIEQLSFYLATLRYPFSQARASKALVFAVLMMGAQVATAAAFFWEKISQTRRR